MVVPPAHLQFPYLPDLPAPPTLEAASSHTSYRRAEDYGRTRDYNGMGEYTPNSDYDYQRMKDQKPSRLLLSFDHILNQVSFRYDDGGYPRQAPPEDYPGSVIIPSPIILLLSRYSTGSRSHDRDPYYEPEYHSPKKSYNQYDRPYHGEKETPYSDRPEYYPEQGSSSSAYSSERSYEKPGYKEDYHPESENNYKSRYDGKEEPKSYSYYRPNKDYQPKRSYDEHDYAQNYPSSSGPGASESRYKSSGGYGETWNPTKDSSGSSSSYGDPNEGEYYSPNYNYGSPARSKEGPRTDYGGAANGYGSHMQDHGRSYDHNEYAASKKNVYQNTKDYGGYKDSRDYGDSYENYGKRTNKNYRSTNYDPGSPGSVHTQSEEKHSPSSSYNMDGYDGSYSRPSEKYGVKSQGYLNNINKYDEFYDDYTRTNRKDYSKFNYNDAYGNDEVSQYNEDSRKSYDQPKNYGASSKFKPKLEKDYGNYDNPEYYPASSASYEYDPPVKRRKRGGRRGQYGSYSSLQPSYNSDKGEPKQAYDPTSWARWVGGNEDGNKVARSRRKGYRRNSSGRQQGVVDSSGWRGSSGPSGPGGSTTTSSMTTSHIIHHYKPEKKDESTTGEEDSVIGAIKKHLPPLPTLPWPFNGVRRMGVDEGEPIFIEELEERNNNYPDSIQSILESIEEEETSLAPEVMYPFLEEEDPYVFDIEQYNGYINNNP